MNIRNRFVSLSCMLIALSVLTSVRSVAQNSPDLPSPAIKVWADTSYNRKDMASHWLSENSLLYLVDREVHQYDLKTGSNTPLVNLNHELQKGKYVNTLWRPFSPDGANFLYWNDYQMIVCTLSGKPTVIPEIGRYDMNRILYPYCWLSDSLSWAELCTDDSRTCSSIRIHSLAEPKQVRTLPVSPPIKIGNGEPIPIADGRLLIFKMNERWIEGGDTSTGEEDETLSCQLITFTIGATSVHTQAKPVSIPVKGGWTEPFPSPKGDRLVWRVRSSIKHQRKESLWMSQLDGTKARRLLEIDWNAPSYYLAFKNLAWLPDGKRISFIYQDALWTLPIE